MGGIGIVIHRHATEGCPLALPREVGEVYLRHPELVPPVVMNDCEACGYHVPYQHFPACPLCGGALGWDAYYKKHGQHPIGREAPPWTYAATVAERG